MARPRKQVVGDFALLEDDQPVDAADIRDTSQVEDLPRVMVTHAALSASQARPVPPPFSTTAGAGRYFVKLNCPTPLLHKDGLEVDAENEEDARAKFCAANNISGSDHSWDIQKVA